MLLTVKHPLYSGIPPSHEYAAQPPPSPHHYHRHQYDSSAAATRETPRVSSPSPAPASASVPVSASALPALQNIPPKLEATTMDSSSRNLPPMSMTLAPPERGPPAMVSTSTPMSAPPPQWQNTEEAMQQSLQAKAEEERARQELYLKIEEERRRQEEERSRQARYRLDLRQIELSILQEALRGGVPPSSIPLMFVGGVEGNPQLHQQYISQIYGSFPQHLASYHQTSLTPPESQPQHYPPTQHQQQQHQQQQQQQQKQQQQQLQHAPSSQPLPASHHPPPPPPPPQQQTQAMPPPSQPAVAQHPPPEPTRDSRMIPPNPYAAQPIPPTMIGPSQSAPSSPSSHPSYARAPHMRPPNQTVGQTLPRINTSEIHTQHPPQNSGVVIYTTSSPATTGSHQPQSSVARLDQAARAQSGRQSQSSPGISFLHWVPPGSQPNTPSGKSPNTSPFSSHPSSHFRSDHQPSPRKRKHASQSGQSSSRSETAPPQPSPGRTSPRKNGRGGNSRHQNQSQHQNQESKQVDLLDPGRPGGQMHVTSLVTSNDDGDARSTSRQESKLDRENKRQRSNSAARFASGRSSNSHGIYPGGVSRDDSQIGPGGHEHSVSSNQGHHSFSAYGSYTHDGSRISNPGPPPGANTYRSPSDPSPIHTREDHSQQSMSA
ncbi:hypothetical protein AJ79_07836 [Helicocarpus griseus UAMH5409]|uniref:Uncharacterized protein n=1 Tax=Helicocarpus griseus UAMH5409 TaxID=1447875 RepID=A0A2B7WYN9_9EURO|nr:hypothetical protein AJ79_07836 [Helicocarpus griseus UAMH5409]